LRRHVGIAAAGSVEKTLVGRALRFEEGGDGVSLVVGD
jgi:hypothetical protein